MRKAAVVGWPIDQSLSPVIHGHWLARNGIEGTYERVGIKPGDLPRKIPEMIAAGFAGFNVTMPHKQDIMSLLADMDDLATRIGAVNTVTVLDGRLHGTNTDAYGFLAHLEDVAAGA